MRDIVFVIGPAGSGKSTFIARNLELGLLCVDLKRYQSDWCKTPGEVLRSYARHRRDCINIAKAIESDFIIEHTMLRAKRRAYYIDKLKDYGNLVCYYAVTPTNNAALSPAERVYEHPSTDEGFSKVIPMRNSPLRATFEFDLEDFWGQEYYRRYSAATQMAGLLYDLSTPNAAMNDHVLPVEISRQISTWCRDEGIDLEEIYS